MHLEELGMTAAAEKPVRSRMLFGVVGLLWASLVWMGISLLPIFAPEYG